MATYSDVVQDSYLRPVPGASVYVLNRDGTQASISPNPVLTDGLGAFAFTAPDAVYDLEYRYGGVTLRQDSVIVGDPDEYRGLPGPAANFRRDIAALKTAAITDLSSIYDRSLWTWETGAAPYTADDVNVVKANSTSLSVGAWVRQGIATTTFTQAGTGAFTRALQDKLRDELNLADFLPTGYVKDASVDYTTQIAAWVAQVKATGKTGVVPDGAFQGLVNIVGPIRLRGNGSQTSYFKKAGRVANVSGEFVHITDMGFWSTGGDHCIQQSGLFAQAVFDRVGIIQQGNAHSLWDNAAHEYIDVRMHHCKLEHTTNATAYSFNLIGAGGTINDNLWRACRIQSSGYNHFFNVETTTANAQYSNRWEDLTFEVCLGGGVRTRGVNGFIISNCQNWDAGPGAIRNDFYDIGSFGGIGSVGQIQDCGRWAGSFASGKFDAKLPGGGGGNGIIISNCRTSGGGDPFKIDAANNGIIVMRPSANVCSITNDAGTLALDTSGGIMFAGKKVVGTQGAGIPQVPSVTSGSTVPVGDYNGLVTSFNALLQRLQASTGHGLIAG